MSEEQLLIIPIKGMSLYIVWIMMSGITYKMVINLN